MFQFELLGLMSLSPARDVPAGAAIGAPCNKPLSARRAATRARPAA